MAARQPARDRETRKADALAMLASPEVDVWVATASPEGAAHLVPVSLAWFDVVDIAEAGPFGEAFAAQADWDPRPSPGYVFLVLRPVRIQAWREANEIPGRTLMRDGAWLV